MTVRHVELTEETDRFIESGIQSGRFIDANQAVDLGLRLLEQEGKDRQARLEWLLHAATEASVELAGGDFVQLSSKQELDDFFNEIHEELGADTVSDRSRV